MVPGYRGGWGYGYGWGGPIYGGYGWGGGYGGYHNDTDIHIHNENNTFNNVTNNDNDVTNNITNEAADGGGGEEGMEPTTVEEMPPAEGNNPIFDQRNENESRLIICNITPFR